MPKKSKIKGNLRPSDKWRVLVTDTAPFEVPIVFSNDGLYKNVQNLEKTTQRISNF